MVFVEPSFPRGGNVEEANNIKPRLKKPRSNVGGYGATTTGEERTLKKRPKERIRALKQADQQLQELQEERAVVPNLLRSDVSNGMLLLGCVSNVGKMDLTVSLPGRMYGTVSVTSISDAYTNRLQAMIVDKTNSCPTLEQLYKLGDLVYVKVIDVSQHKLELSLNPTVLHSEISARQLVEGLVLSATIVTKEDHGFSMEIGVNNTQAFLNAKGLHQTEIGSNVMCRIKKVTKVGKTRVLVLSAFGRDEPYTLDVTMANIDTIVPGCTVTFTVERYLQNGMKGTLFDDTIPAFANVNMLDRVKGESCQYKLFQRVEAKILYVTPLTKNVFVSLASFPKNRFPTESPIAKGTVIRDATVLKCTGYSVHMLLNKMHRALLMRPKTPGKGNYDPDVVMAKYQVGSKHEVRVMAYSMFDRMLIVTDDQETIKASYFSLQDVTVGNVYTCTVQKILQNGYAVLLGKLHGNVFGFHFDESSPKLPVGSSLKLRLMWIEESKILLHFTNHQLYLDGEAPVLLSLDNVEKSEQYVGTVIKDGDTYFKVSFCNRISGLIFKEDDKSDYRKVAALRVGSVALFTVKKVIKDEQKIRLCLPFTDCERLGAIYNATVTGVHDYGVDITIPEVQQTGTIPNGHFSDFPEHNCLYLNLLEQGEDVLVANIGNRNFSMRDVSYFKTAPTSWQQLQPHMILRAVIEGKKDDKALVRLPLCDYSKLVAVEIPIDKCEIGQVVMLRVGEGNNGNQLPNLEISLKRVCNLGVPDVLWYTLVYLLDVQKLLHRYKHNKSPFAQYTVGQEVDCTVETILADDKVLMVKILNDANMHTTKGIAKWPHRHCKVGDRFKGRIVWLDVEKQQVHVCVHPKILQHLVDDDKLNMKLLCPEKTQPFVTLFSNQHVSVGYLPDVECPLVIVPAQGHYNDFDPSPVALRDNIVLFKPLENMVFGMTIKMYKKFTGLEAKTKTRKRTTKQQRASKSVESLKPRSGDSKRLLELPEDYEEEIIEGSEGEEMSEEDPEGVLSDSASSGSSDSAEDEDYTPPVEVTKLKAVKLKKTKGLTKMKKKRKLEVSSEENDKPKVKKMKKFKKDVASSDHQIKLSMKKKLQKQNGQTNAKKKRKMEPFVLSQLDGAEDLEFFRKAPLSVATQMDGADDIGSRNRKKAVKRPGKPISTKSKPTVGLPGTDNFWDSTPVYHRQQVDSSSSSDDDDDTVAAPKVRLTAKERFEAMREKEREIRQKEDELASAAVDPHTPDQFDRLLLAQPNNSMIWIRYMAFHMESAELQKARAIARKALKTINYREESERLNIWIALLNLEIRYESVDAYHEVLQEALQCNDPFKVYSRAIDILVDCEKPPEVREVVEVLLKKFRKNPEMWLLVADCYYRTHQGHKTKPLLSQALKSLENREHIPLIVKFAFLHNRNENHDEAQLLFEQILTSYPKRTDIWSQYIDMLVKNGLIDLARQILERAIIQKLPMKNMKTLYTKFVNFEEKHGDRDSVRRVKQMASDYVNGQLSKAGV